MLTANPQIEAGTLRALASPGPPREAAANVPTVAEAGVPGYSALQWYGLLAPAGTPATGRRPLPADLAEALRLPDVRERLAPDGAEPMGGTAVRFAALMGGELEKWATIAKAANIQAE